MTLHSRSLRVAEEVRHGVAEILHQEMKDPRLQEGLVSVTSVEMSKDLTHARVWVSVLGDEQAVKDALGALKQAKGYIKRLLGERVVLRFLPDLDFKYDDTLARADRINRLLKEAGVEPGDAGSSTENNAEG